MMQRTPIPCMVIGAIRQLQVVCLASVSIRSETRQSMNANAAFMALSLCARINGDLDPAKTINEIYRGTSAAIVAEDIESLSKTAYRSFEAADTDVRKTWDANFKAVAVYGPIEFRVE